MKISIVIPLYNKERSIKRAIKSVLNQTYRDIELIIVDDGSTDNSLLKAKEIEDDRIFIYRQENQGVSAARNKGIELSRSCYICLLDADDEWLPNHLENIVKLIKKEPNAGLYLSRFAEYDAKGEYFLGNISLPENYIGEVYDFFRTFANSRSLVCSSNSCINKEYFEQIEGGFPIGRKVGEDIYVWLRLALISKVLFSSEVTSLIHRDAENRTENRVVISEIGYHHLWFSEKLKDPSFFINKRESLTYFLVKNIFVQTGGMLEKGHTERAKQSSKILMTYKYLYGVILYLLTFLPPFVFTVIRKIRNKITTNRAL